MDMGPVDTRRALIFSEMGSPRSGVEPAAVQRRVVDVELDVAVPRDLGDVQELVEHEVQVETGLLRLEHRAQCSVCQWFVGGRYKR